MLKLLIVEQYLEHCYELFDKIYSIFLLAKEMFDYETEQTGNKGEQ